jgi:hypothetical protein
MPIFHVRSLGDLKGLTPTPLRGGLKRTRPSRSGGISTDPLGKRSVVGIRRVSPLGLVSAEFGASPRRALPDVLCHGQRRTRYSGLLKLSEIVQASGCSKASAWDIRRGKPTPHVRPGERSRSWRNCALPGHIVLPSDGPYREHPGVGSRAGLANRVSLLRGRRLGWSTPSCVADDRDRCISTRPS